MAVRVVPPSVTHAAADLDSSAVWNAGPVASNTFLTTVPIFTGHLGAAISVATGTIALIPLTVTGIDTDNGHSNVTNSSRYTAQVAGYYAVSGTVTWAVSGVGDRAVWLTRNGGTVAGSGNVVPAGADLTVTPTGMVIVLLNATDYVEMSVLQTSGGALNAGPAGGLGQNCYLHVWWVSHVF